MARHDIRGIQSKDGTYLLSAKDIYNTNDNFIQLSHEIFGNSSFTRKIEKRVSNVEGEVEAIIDRVDGIDGDYAELIIDIDSITTRVGNAEGDLSEVIQTASGLVSTVSSHSTTLGTHTTQISQNATSISSKVSSTDYNGNTIASLINQTATTIAITASKINLNGLVTANNNFKILTDGSMEAKNAKLTGEINTVDGNGKAVRIMNRNLIYYSPTTQKVRGILSSAEYPTSTSEGTAILLPNSTLIHHVFSIARMTTFNETTGIWATDSALFQAMAAKDGHTSVIIGSDQLSTDARTETIMQGKFFALKAIQRGNVTLNTDTAVTVTFTQAMQGHPTIVLTPTHSITGAVITAKIVSASTTGFSAIIQGFTEYGNVTFYWIAIA